MGTEHAGGRYGVKLGKGCPDVHTYANTIRHRDSERDRNRHTRTFTWDGLPRCKRACSPEIENMNNKAKTFSHTPSVLAGASRLKKIYSANNYTLLTVTVQDLAGSLTDHRTGRMQKSFRTPAPPATPPPPHSQKNNTSPPLSTSRTCAADAVPVRSARCGR